MNRFKLLGLLILSSGIFAAQGAVGERDYYKSLSLDELERMLLLRTVRAEDKKEIMKIIKQKEANEYLRAFDKERKEKRRAKREGFIAQKMEDQDAVVEMPEKTLMLTLASDGIVAALAADMAAKVIQSGVKTVVEMPVTIMYPNGDQKVFIKKELNNFILFRNMIEHFTNSETIQLESMLQGFEYKNELFDFVVALANATEETIDALRARLSECSFNDLVKIARMLDVLMLDNDNFNIEQFVADLLLKKFGELSIKDQASFDLSLVPRSVAKKYQKYVLDNNNIKLQFFNVKFSPDGKKLAIIDLNCNLQIFDAQTLVPIPGAMLQNIYSVAFSPDGKRLAVAYLNGNVQILDAQTLVVISGAMFQQPFNLDEFSPDGRRLVVTPIFFHGNWQILDAETLVQIPCAALQGARKVVFSPDGITVTIIYKNGDLQILDAQTLVSILGEALQGVLNVSFSPDGRKVAVIYKNGDLQILDAQTLVQIPGAALQGFSNVEFSPDGKKLVVIDLNCNRQILDAETLVEIPCAALQGARKVVFSQDGRRLLVVNYNNECQICEHQFLLDALLELQTQALARLEAAREEWRQRMRRKKSVNSACTIS